MGHNMIDLFAACARFVGAVFSVICTSMALAQTTPHIKLLVSPGWSGFQSTKLRLMDGPAVGNSACCRSFGPKPPICIAIDCTITASEQSTSSIRTRLFEGANLPKPHSICELCESRPIPICAAILCERPDQAKTSPVSLEQFRLDLESIRRINDAQRAANDISALQSRAVLKAYKRDYQEEYLKAINRQPTQLP
jgi:hypothetical protein